MNIILILSLITFKAYSYVKPLPIIYVSLTVIFCLKLVFSNIWLSEYLWLEI